MNKKHRNYETELPEGYEAVYVVDAATKKFTIWLNVAALILMVALIVPAYFVIKPFQGLSGTRAVSFFLFAGASIAYIILHELVHGAAYKLTTGQKLSFGMTATVAYCGVPNIYVYRKASLIALLAPFTVFSILFALTTVLISAPLEKFLSAVLFAMHFSGCVGDLYDTILYLTKFKDPKTLMRDTGPKQTFYLPKRG